MTLQSTLRTMLLPLALLAGAAPLCAQQAAEDFQPGDVVRLEVEGDTLFTGTFTVGPGPVLPLPVIGNVSLAGVRRAELESHLREQLGRYLKNSVVHAKALIRLSIVGEFLRPGVYAVPTDLVLSDVLMVAGGPTAEAKFTDLRIERESQRLIEGDELQQALAHGKTVGDLRLRAGDRIFVPRVVRRDPESTWRIIGIIAALPVAIFAVTQLGKGR